MGQSWGWQGQGKPKSPAAPVRVGCEQRGQAVPTEDGSHLAECDACRRLDRDFLRTFGPDGSGPVNVTPDWAEAGPVNVLGKQPDLSRPKGRNPANVCQECGGWKGRQYPTCLNCSGMVLCDVCGEKWHPAEYETCYDCR